MYKVFSRLGITARDISDKEWNRMTKEERIMFLDKNPNSRFAKREEKKEKAIKHQQQIMFDGFSAEELNEYTDFRKLKYKIYNPTSNALIFVNSKGEEPVTIELMGSLRVWFGIGSQQSKTFSDYDENFWKFIKVLLQKFK